MGKVPVKPKAVRTPGSYNHPGAARNLKSPSATPKSSRIARRRDVGRPKTGKRGKKKASSRKDNYRTTYTQEDIDEAVRLVLEEGYAVRTAAVLITGVKKNKVPRMTLADRLRQNSPKKRVELGRPLVKLTNWYQYLKIFEI